MLGPRIPPLFISSPRPCVLPSISLHLPDDPCAENKRASNDYGIKRETALLTEPDISLNEESEERGCLHLTGFRMAGMHAGLPNSSSDLSLICQDDSAVKLQLGEKEIRRRPIRIKVATSDRR